MTTPYDYALSTPPDDPAPCDCGSMADGAECVVCHDWVCEDCVEAGEGAVCTDGRCCESYCRVHAPRELVGGVCRKCRDRYEQDAQSLIRHVWFGG